MGLLTWIVLGLIAGAIASFFAGGGFGLIEMIVLGVIGAIVGGSSPRPSASATSLA